MTLVVRDEDDVLEANLDYHLGQGVDFVIVTDHGSSDATPEILRRYEAKGVLHVIREEGVEHHQARRVTRMARLAADRFGADWVFHNDADEFWWPQVGSLRDVLEAIPPAYGQLRVPRRNFLPVPPGPEPFYERMSVREDESRNGLGEPLEGKIAHRAVADATVAPGCHSVSGAGLEPALDVEVVEIMHFPIRSFAQFERKVVTIGLGYESLPDRSPDVGRDQLELLARHRAGRLREHFDAALLDDAQIEAGLRSGALVRDRRLARFLAEADGRDPALERPDGPPARRFVTRAVGTAAELVTESRRRAELEYRNAELEAHTGRVERHNAELQAHSEGLDAHVAMLEGHVATLEGHVGRLDGKTHELARTLGGRTHELEVIRSSRLMRYTDAPRRLWYRLTER